MVERLAEVLTNLVIIAYLYFAWFWSSPPGSVWRLPFRYVSSAVVWLGLHHGWNMFSPPVKASEYIEAEIFFENGESNTWHATHVDELGAWQAFCKMRHRKYQRSVFTHYPKGIRSALAEFLRHRYAPHSKPIQIDIYATYRAIPAPREAFANNPHTERHLIHRWRASNDDH